MAIRIISNAGGNWSATTSWVEGAVPTSADEVRATVTSGNLVLNVASTCRSLDLTGYLGTFSSTAGYGLTIGDNVFPTGGVALKLAGTYNPYSTSYLYFNSSALGEHTIDTNGSPTRALYFYNSANYKFLSDITTTSNGITHTGGILDFNSVNVNTIGFASTGAVARTVRFGASKILDPIGDIVMTGSNLTIEPNTAVITYTGGYGFRTNDGVDTNGLSIKLGGVATTIYIYSTCIIKDLIIDPDTTKTLSITPGKTLTITGDLFCFPRASSVVFTNGTISKATGVVNMYSISQQGTVFTGGATWNALNNSTFYSGSGVSFLGGAFYIDFENGSDALFGAYGWWKVNYLDATGTPPTQDEVGTGSVSGATCKITGMINLYDWRNSSGTLFFYGKQGTFQAERIQFANGGSMAIASDLSSGAWKTYPLAAKHSERDEMRYPASPAPTSLGQTARWTSTSFIGGAFPALGAPASSTNSTPIIITKAAHGCVTGDIVHLYNHAVNTNANGVWSITWLSANTFSLDSSVGNGVGAATGSLYKTTSKAVILTTAVTDEICLCDASWTPGTNVTSAALQQTYWKFSAGCPQIVTGATCGANQILAKFGWTVPLNLSTKYQVSFWFKSVTAIINSGDLLIKLYSDTACTIEVESLPFPYIPNPSASYWTPVTLNKGTFLSASVRGIALYTTVAQPSKTFYIDNIIACKDPASPDSLSLQSLISKNNSLQVGDDLFVAIQSIKGRILLLDNSSRTPAYYGRGYVGVSEDVTLFKRESSKTMHTIGLMSITRAGSLAGSIFIKGGFDKITNTKTGVSILDGLNAAADGLTMNAAFINIEDFCFVRFSTGIYSISSNSVCQRLSAFNCGVGVATGAPINVTIRGLIAVFNDGNGIAIGYQSTYLEITGIVALSNSMSGVIVQTASVIPTIISNNNYTNGVTISSIQCAHIQSIIACNYNSCGLFTDTYITQTLVEEVLNSSFNGYGVNLNGHNVTILKIIKINNNTNGIAFIGDNHLIKEIVEFSNSVTNMVAFYGNASKILKITTANANKAFVSFSGFLCSIYNANLTNTILDGTSIVVSRGHNYLINCTGLTTNFTFSSYGANYKLFIHNYNTLNNHCIYFDSGCSIVCDTLERHSLTGVSWKFQVRSILRGLYNPLDLSVAKILCEAGVRKTIGLWVKKSHATDIGGRLVIVGNKYAGVGTTVDDVFTEVVNVTDWQQISMSFTPSKTEVIEVEFWAYWLANATTQSIWIDDISII